MTRVPFKRLVIFIHSMGGGGAERVTANLANHWAGKGWELTVVTLEQCSLDAYELHPAVERISLGLAGDSANIVTGLWQNLRRVMAMRRVLRKTQPDIALGMMTGANVLLSVAALGLRIRAVGSEHVHPAQYPLSSLWEMLRRHTYGWLHTVTALTSESANWLETHTNVQRVSVIPNAAPWPLPVQEPKVCPMSVCPIGRKVLLGVGRLEVEKGFDWLLEAFTGLAQKHPDWDLVILGEGSLRTTIEDQVQVAGLGKRAFLPGRVGNVGEWYERADLYVMSSRFEGFGNTLAEALAYGLPAVSFDCDTGPRNIIRHETDGLLVPPGDVTGLAGAMDLLMGDVDLRKRFAARGVEARERFSIMRIAGMWEELFEEVVK
jgi:glycosyltransferase involved in cell wall biosynthesis